MNYYKGSCLWSRVHAHLARASASPAAAQCPPEGPPRAHPLWERCWNSCPEYLAPRQMPAQPAAMHSFSAISCFGVLRAATPGLHESEGHVSIPAPAHGGEENSICHKRVPRNRGDSFAETMRAQ